MPKKPIEERTFSGVRERHYYANIDRSGDCWLWLGGKNAVGTGALDIYAGGQRFKSAHRFTWFLETGDLPGPDELISHTCGNPLCQRVTHMIKTTKKTRLRDDWVANQPQSEKLQVNRRQMTEETAQHIRALRAQGRTITSIMAEVGFTYKTVSFVLSGKSHVGIKRGPKPGSKNRPKEKI